MELTKLSKQDDAKLKVLGWANVYCRLKDENEKKWKRRVIKFGTADKLKAQAFFFSGPTDHQPKGRIDLMDLVEVYIEGEILFVQTAFSFWHIDPEGKNLDKKILEMWFQQFTAPMNEVRLDSKRTIGHHYFDLDPQGITNFCWEYCEGVDQFQMIKWVNKGANVAHTMYSKPENEWKPLSCKTPSTQAQVVALIWLLTAKSASYGELFTGGVFRVDDQEGKLFRFLNSCEPFVYKRISSHYPERADETYKLHGPQRGIDISEPEVKLPTSKKTILFFRLADLCVSF